MKIIQAPRASAILYQLLVSQQQKRPWILPANICPIVPITFMKARIPFELVDISAESLHLDLDQAEAWIRKQGIGGLLYGHTYGEPSAPNEFFDFAKSLNPDMLLVDDRCLCVPGFDESSSADVILYSTGYAKIVDLNFGGYAFLSDRVDYQPMSLPFDPKRYEEIEQSYKNTIQDRVRFSYHDCDWLETDASLPQWADYRLQIESGVKSSLTQRARLNAIYNSHLALEIQLPLEYQTWRFNIRVKNKMRLLKAIFGAGLFASSHYASLTGIMSEGRAPVAESLAHGVINLFNDHHFDDQKAEEICALILKNRDWLS